jgi:hypothetical protein
MLMWHQQLWLIDHGAAFYFHHGWDGSDRSADPFALVKNHVLLKAASALETVDAVMSASITPELVREIVALVPDAWLAADTAFGTPAAIRDAYVNHLTRRLIAPRPFMEEALRARAQLV